MAFDLRKFQLTSAATTAILVGVIVKNTFEQLGQSSPISVYLGPAFFVLGWLGLAYSLSLTNGTINIRNKKTQIFFACAVGIVVSVMTMKGMMKEGKEPPVYLKIIFAAAWLLLGYTLDPKLGLAAAGLVLASMLFALPWQRKNKVIDGPGMPMFVIGLGLIVYANSH